MVVPVISVPLTSLLDPVCILVWQQAPPNLLALGSCASFVMDLLGGGPQVRAVGTRGRLLMQQL